LAVSDKIFSYLSFNNPMGTPRFERQPAGNSAAEHERIMEEFQEAIPRTMKRP
jgi:hypothetical protein